MHVTRRILFHKTQLPIFHTLVTVQRAFEQGAVVQDDRQRTMWGGPTTLADFSTKRDVIFCSCTERTENAENNRFLRSLSENEREQIIIMMIIIITTPTSGMMQFNRYNTVCCILLLLELFKNIQ